ncbi:hypothetical protein F4805DRAFT_462183 [Annulohypoxylon moriforme]|nr:hypothetical protein F4805DRAFT_462183 [Annulohypoxylon moriforme]
MSAACSRGLTWSHTSPIPPIPPIPPVSPVAPLPSTPVRRPVPPSTPVRRPHPFRGRPVDEAAAVTSSDSPLMGYIPTPIQAPIFSPIRSPFSPCGSFPATPSTPPTKHFVSPIKEGARERRRESRPSPLTSLLASKGIQREVTPRPRALCPECTKVKMLLPARWCGHQVTPSRMKNGWRVVRINPNLGKTKVVKAQKPRESRHAGLERAKLAAADSSGSQAGPQTPVVYEPVAKPNTPEHVSERVASQPIIDEPTVAPSTPVRASASPIVESTPTPEPSTVCSPSVHTPFRNPDLSDQPLHWSPRMFETEIDRHNWTWSEWDSPSQTIEDVTYETDDWPIHDPFARYPPHIRQRLRDVLAMKPELTHSSNSAEGFSPIEFHYDGFGIKQGSSSEEKDDATSSDLSDWVLINERPWSPTLLQMWIDSEKDRERQAARRKQFQPSDDTSTVSSLATADLLSEIHCSRRNHPGPSRPESDHPESIHSEPNRSGSVNMSSLLQLYIDSDNDRQRWETEEKGAGNSSAESIPDPVPCRPNAPTPSMSRPDASISSTPTPGVASTPASVQDVPTLPESTPEVPNAISEPAPEATTPPPAPVIDAPALPQSEDEFSSWIDLDTRKWTDLTFRFHTRQEEGRRMGCYDNTSDDSDSEDSGFSFDITGHLQKNYGITVVPQEHFRALREAQQPSVEAQSAAASMPPVTSPSFTARRQLPSATVMQPCWSLEESSRRSGFGWKSLACVAVTAAAVGAGLAYAWFSG